MDPLLSPKSLAVLLGIAEQTIYNRHSTGGHLPPAIKLGRLLRFRAVDVEAWLARQCETSTTKNLPSPGLVMARRPGRPTKKQQVEARKAVH